MRGGRSSASPSRTGRCWSSATRCTPGWTRVRARRPIRRTPRSRLFRHLRTALPARWWPRGWTGWRRLWQSGRHAPEQAPGDTLGVMIAGAGRRPCSCRATRWRRLRRQGLQHALALMSCRAAGAPHGARGDRADLARRCGLPLRLRQRLLSRLCARAQLRRQGLVRLVRLGRGARLGLPRAARPGAGAALGGMQRRGASEGSWM